MNKKSSKIGILGGTFNPIHNGHLIIAQNALEWCDLDKVLIMPSGVSYLKDPSKIVSTSHRINMVSLAISSNNCFELSTIETDRSGNSYTYETLEQLKATDSDSEFFFIIGADTLYSIEYWKNPERIFSNCTIICAIRDNYTIEDLYKKINELEEKFTARIILMTIPEVNISSSEIRDFIKSGKSAKYYMPDEVLEYISDNCLYK